MRRSNGNNLFGYGIVTVSAVELVLSLTLTSHPRQYCIPEMTLLPTFLAPKLNSQSYHRGGAIEK